MCQAKRWEKGTMAILLREDWFYAYRDGELLFGESARVGQQEVPRLPLKPAGTLVRVLEEAEWPTHRGTSLRRVLVEAGIGTGPYAWVRPEDLKVARFE